MKLVKLSLVAALAAGAFSAANAVSLEEAIKDVDVSGMFRYRFESDRRDVGNRPVQVGVNPNGTPKMATGTVDGYNSSKENKHKFKSQLNFKAALDDNFKAFVQFQYSTSELGFNSPNAKAETDTDSTFAVQQAYLEYTNEAYATNVIFGKMEVGSIWTDDAVGTGAKILNNSIEGLTFAGYWFDSFNVTSDGDFTGLGIADTSLYGAAVLGDFDPFAFQVWAAYSNNWAFLYAVDASYKFAFNDMANFKIQAQYLGNSLDSDKEKLGLDNSNFYAAQLQGQISAFDFQAGIVGYGEKDKASLVVLEDKGRVIAPGEQIFYSEGSDLRGSTGENFFYFAGLGYTFAETVRVGFDYIGGKSEQVGHDIDKNEYIARVSYAYSPKLTFSGFYSYLTEDFNQANTDDTKDQYIRLEALYKF
ncbi:TPA: major outer membrane protein [Campylobacter lari]|uniref:major outer membrane protein n=1 Tax=Campylobacter TaxID=194 RepID=UPI001059D92A|nr:MULTISPECIES: major outer membrane protein [Campylobacter]EAI4441853.1 major outer membrane protein [Campylobacter lari]EDP6880618.1 major outer membrane protein [Campylobacter lari]MCV3410024.1 major outer membrane protein [Campylobacter sp. IFREMER_LSEM_CL1890]TDJ88481.1 major outer membrane protein [Campylobacter lari]HEC1798093.1 major outer membrane protein [Campylobacter lari]